MSPQHQRVDAIVKKKRVSVLMAPPVLCSVVQCGGVGFVDQGTQGYQEIVDPKGHWEVGSSVMQPQRAVHTYRGSGVRSSIPFLDLDRSHMGRGKLACAGGGGVRAPFPDPPPPFWASVTGTPTG